MSLAMESGHATVGFRYDCVAGVREILADDRVERSLRIFTYPQMAKLALGQLNLAVEIVSNGRPNNISYVFMLIGRDLF